MRPLYLAVKGKVREVIRNLKSEDLGQADGFALAIQKLQK